MEVEPPSLMYKDVQRKYEKIDERLLWESLTPKPKQVLFFSSANNLREFRETCEEELVFLMGLPTFNLRAKIT